MNLGGSEGKPGEALLVTALVLLTGCATSSTGGAPEAGPDTTPGAASGDPSAQVTATGESGATTAGGAALATGGMPVWIDP